MSLHALEEVLSDLPYALREQVFGYARSIDVVSEEICRNAGVQPSSKLLDQLVFVAGLRKLFSIVDSNYWIIDNAGALLSQTADVGQVRIGSTDFSRRGQYHLALEQMRRDFLSLLDENSISEFVVESDYQEIARMLADGR
ncbi:MAG: hypothetical protein RIC89_05085 [Pseudomonadales bacterium]